MAMNRKFIIDKEINLNDRDFLKTKVYAGNLTEIIKNTSDNKVFTIGLFGSWGTGKSSIIETSKINIEKENSKIKFITYDAWKYSHDSFRRMFLLKVQDELKQEQTIEMQRFYQSENAEAKPKQVFSIKGLSSIIIVLLALIGIIWTLPFFLQWCEFTEKLEWTWQIPVTSILTLMTLLISISNGLFHYLKISINKPALFAPEQFEECFKQMMEISLRKEWCIIRGLKKVVEYVQRGTATITNLDKIVIVIDNIDRCHSAMAYQLLTDIKTFLSNEEYNVVFVIPVDDEALRKHIVNNNKNSEGSDESKAKEEFLRKFFNVTLRIKPHQTLEMQVFARELNKSHGLKFNNDTLSLVAKEFATNPRRIIQLFNNLSAELNLYPEDFAVKNEAIICAIIILKEEYNLFYTRILKNAKLLKEGHEDMKNAELNSFLRIADPYFKNAEISDILQILTNTKALFDSIPNEIQEAVRKNDIDGVVSFIEKNTESKMDAMQLIHHHIIEDSKYNSSLQMVNWLSFVSKISDSISIERVDYIKFDSELKKYYRDIIPKSTDVNLICKYTNRLNELGMPDLKNIIIEHISIEQEKKSENLDDYVKAIFGIFNSEDDSKSLASFAEKYFTENIIFDDIDYSEEQMKYLFTDKIIMSTIEAIKELNKNDIAEELLWLFKEKPNISIDTYGKFFSHISNLIGEMRNKTKDEIISYINFLTPFIANIKDRNLKEEPEELFAKLFNPRGICNPSYPRHLQYDIQTEFINECMENEDESKLIIDFLCHIYRITSDNISLHSQFNSIAYNHRSYFNSKLIELLNKNFTLIPLFDIILSDENYSSEKTIVLLKQCFTQKEEDGTRYISDEQITNKIKLLLDNVSNSKVLALINNLIADDSIKQIVIDDIVNRDSAFINSLPQELLSFAINAFTSQAASNYSANYVYLAIIAKKGNDSQKTVLVKLLQNDINNNQNIEKVLSVLDALEITKLTDINLLLALLNSYKENSLDENDELNDRINSLISKFNSKEKKVLKEKKH